MRTGALRREAFRDHLFAGADRAAQRPACFLFELDLEALGSDRREGGTLPL